MHLTSLRARILATLATSSLVAVACGGQTTPGTSSSGASSSGASSSGSSSGASSSGTSGSSSGASSSGTTPTCANGGTLERTCFNPKAIITKNSGYGGVPPDPDAAPPPPPTRDANGCVVLDEVMNGCCNAAVGGPELEGGKCCYQFCAGACCGRPLVVAGEARRASVRARSDWGGRDGASSDLDAVTRRALAVAWTRDALEEHASIASFAAFTLDLLALGAPAELVAAAQRAGADEIEHARLTFAVASRYAEGPLGPGALDLRGVTPSTDLAAVAGACVRDGCVNETLASAIASAQAERAADPDLRATLERIARDEADHAALAWSFVRWAIAQGGPPVRDAVFAAFETSPPRASALDAEVDLAKWSAHGRLSPTEHDDVARRVLREVVEPCRAALVERAAHALA